MSEELGIQERVLTAVGQHMLRAGLRARLIEPEGEGGFFSLVTRFPDIGAEDASIDVEMFLPPGTTVPEEGAFLLQIFATLESKVPSLRHDDCRWLLTTLNSKLPLGHFGLIESNGSIYFKHGLLLETELGDVKLVRLIDRQAGMMVHLLQSFYDLIHAVASGKEGGMAALAAHPLGAVYAQ